MSKKLKKITKSIKIHGIKQLEEKQQKNIWKMQYKLSHLYIMKRSFDKKTIYLTSFKKKKNLLEPYIIIW